MPTSAVSTRIVVGRPAQGRGFLPSRSNPHYGAARPFRGDISGRTKGMRGDRLDGVAGGNTPRSPDSPVSSWQLDMRTGPVRRGPVPAPEVGRAAEGPAGEGAYDRRGRRPSTRRHPGPRGRRRPSTRRPRRRAGSRGRCRQPHTRRVDHRPPQGPPQPRQPQPGPRRARRARPGLRDRLVHRRRPVAPAVLRRTAKPARIPMDAARLQPCSRPLPGAAQRQRRRRRGRRPRGGVPRLPAGAQCRGAVRPAHRVRQPRPHTRRREGRHHR